jgi:hypothetical protein
MTYQIVPRDDTVMVKIVEDGISETLTLLEAPPEDSILVQQGKKDVLGEINPIKMLTNLDYCVDLLQITFNAVDGFKVRYKVRELSNDFIDAMSKSNVTALDFKLATEGAVGQYLLAYGNLFYGEIETAIELLADTKRVAAKRVQKADELVKIYDGLTNYTNVVLKEVMDERAADENKRSETTALIKELEGSIKAIDDLKERLRQDIAQFEADYKKLQEREMKQEGRAYNMQMASMIIGAVSGIFGAATNAVSPNRQAERDQAEAQAGAQAGDRPKPDPSITAQEIQKITATLAERAEVIRKRRDELKDHERADLIKLAENIAKMQDMVRDTNPLESAIQCLIIMVGCLRRVLAYLQAIKLFWMNVETFGDSLASNDSLTKLVSSQANKVPEQRAAYFKTILFVKGFIGVLAKWQALYVIFSEYLVALARVSQRMSDTLKQSLDLDHKVQWKLATQLADSLKNKLEREMSEI